MKRTPLKRTVSRHPNAPLIARSGFLFDWIKAALPILAPLSFMVSVGTNELVFERWGLRFIQIASPADVLMSGVELFFILALQFGVMLLAVAVGNRLGSTAAGRLSAVAATPLALIAGAVRVRMAALVGFAEVLEAALMVLAGCGLCLGAFWRRRGEVGPRIGLAVTTLLAVTILVTFEVLSVIRTLNTGYVATDVATAKVTIPGEKECFARVLWLGEHAAVVACEDSNGSTHALLSREGVLPLVTPTKTATESTN